MSEEAQSQDPPRPFIGVGVVVLRGAPANWEVLLIQRGKPPRAGSWSLPGGHQEWGESLQETACREVMEETGLAVEVVGLIDVVDAISRDDQDQVHRHYSLIDYLAFWSAGEAVAGSDAADLCWVPSDQLSEFELWSETERVITLALAMATSLRAPE